MVVFENTKKPVNRFDDHDRKQADRMFGAGKWVEHICPDQHNEWAIHAKGLHKNNGA